MWSTGYRTAAGRWRRCRPRASAPWCSIWGCPRTDGLSVLRWLRHSGRGTPVVIVTARDRVADRIAGLDAGADDYLIKPFDIDELAARLRAITRRADGWRSPYSPWVR